MSGGLPHDPTSVDAAMHSLRMQVTPGNVLQLHHAVRAEALLVDGELRKNGYPVQVGIAADESVSRMAAQGFNTKIQALVRQVGAYKDGLLSAADELKAQAVRYGHTEQEIKTSFDRFQAGYR